MSTRIDAWLTAALEDADRRGLPELKPLLETMARSTTALRAAEARLMAQESGRREDVATESSKPLPRP
jgi:hypothetical protein